MFMLNESYVPAYMTNRQADGQFARLFGHNHMR